MSKQTIGGFLEGIIISCVFALLPRFFGAFHMTLPNYVVIMATFIFLILFCLLVYIIAKGMLEEQKERRDQAKINKAIAEKLGIKLETKNDKINQKRT